MGTQGAKRVYGRVVIAVALLVLNGCAHTALPAAGGSMIADLMPGGAAAPSPAGWVDYCRRHDGDSACRHGG